MKDFIKRVDKIYHQLNEVGTEAREIITAFAHRHGGNFDIPINDDDHPWVGEERFATAITTEANGNILIHNSACYSEYLSDMDDFNILDLAMYLATIENE